MTLGDDILSLPPPKADARVAYGGDGNQFVDLRVPQGKGPYPLAICIHGGILAGEIRSGIFGASVRGDNVEESGDREPGVP